MYYGEYETPTFTFRAFALTKKGVKSLLKKYYEGCLSYFYGCSKRDLVPFFADDINYIKFKMNEAFKDWDNYKEYIGSKEV